MKKFHGIYPALVTPFDREGRVNASMLQKLVEKLQDDGVNGFYVGGSTGESYLLSVKERKLILEATAEACRPGQDIIANIGMLATEHSIELAEHAQKLGAAAISSVPPFYFPFNIKEYLTYYSDLSEAVDVPVLVYNIPTMSGVKFSIEDLESLLGNEKITGIKHTSYDLFQLQQLIQNYPEKNMFIGHDELFLSALAIGAKAGIGSAYNIMPVKFQNLMKAFEKCDLDKAKEIQGEINSIIAVLSKVGVFKGIKEILSLQGYDCGVCRKPFLPLSDGEREVIREAAVSCGLV